MSDAHPGVLDLPSKTRWCWIQICNYVAEKPQEFRSSGHCPIPVGLSLPDEGGFETTLRLHSAQWHTSKQNCSEKKASIVTEVSNMLSYGSENPKGHRAFNLKTRLREMPPRDSHDGKLHSALTWTSAATSIKSKLNDSLRLISREQYAWCKILQMNPTTVDTSLPLITRENMQGKGTIAKLPVNDTDILPVDLGSKELFVPACNASLKAAVWAETLNQTEKYGCKPCTDSGKRGTPKSMSWSQFHAEHLETC